MASRFQEEPVTDRTECGGLSVGDCWQLRLLLNPTNGLNIADGVLRRGRPGMTQARRSLCLPCCCLQRTVVQLRAYFAAADAVQHGSAH